MKIFMDFLKNCFKAIFIAGFLPHKMKYNKHINSDNILYALFVIILLSLGYYIPYIIGAVFLPNVNLMLPNQFTVWGEVMHQQNSYIFLLVTFPIVYAQMAAVQALFGFMGAFSSKSTLPSCNKVISVFNFAGWVPMIASIVTENLAVIILLFTKGIVPKYLFIIFIVELGLIIPWNLICFYFAIKVCYDKISNWYAWTIAIICDICAYAMLCLWLF